ncbi:thioredoxin family protein [Flavimarina sp. Hel_I_48]|uniref:thioredoxin family protein n=1 Tax=Flavimarina sp. Hel_I_48 TaxID=1392488 RepID=UPI0004DF20D7|nr:thioredoxin family protein [Flavimarina sp. Hel_I_48]
MKKLVLILLTCTVLAATGCKSLSGKNTQKQEQMNESIPEEKSFTEVDGILVGEIGRQQFEKETYAKWFEPRYDAYTIHEDDVAVVHDLMKGIDVTVLMGTWCPDSRREVPNFFKILDITNTSPDIELIAVSRAKTTPAGLENGKQLQRVPTFIFSKNGKELGRIVEYPIESLEKDIIKILSGEEYKHAYEN